MGEFYVGYLEMPRGIKRFTRVLVAIALVLVVGVALVLASQQRDPGDARWADSEVALEGTIAAGPYAALLMPGQPQELLLLVSTGKAGAWERVAPLVGRRVRIHGSVLVRGEARLLELSDGPEAIEDMGVSQNALLEFNSSPTAIELHGEIIDPKCYCGAMKPGAGKTHKACASLCLRGGIPPMFVASDDPTRPFLLLSEEGDAFAADQLETIIGFVGESVALTAKSGTLAGMPVLLVDLSSVHRE